MRVKFSALLAIPAAALLVSGCFKGGGQVSPTTGWNYNEAENGGFEVVSGNEQETGPGLVLIEGGTFTMGRVEQDVTYDWNNTAPG
jgi:formylglycine-generating enzyme required for sulfatase activity